LGLAGLILGYVSILLTTLLVLALLPALKAAKSQGESFQCLNNLRQIGMAVRIYAEVNQGQYPQTTAQFGRHLGYSKFLVCPLDLVLLSRKPDAQDFSRTSYLLTLEGASENTPHQIIARCPKHDHVLTASGTVRPARPPVRPVTSPRP